MCPSSIFGFAKIAEGPICPCPQIPWLEAVLTECKRPNCKRPRHEGHRGFCTQHHQRDQAERAARGEWTYGREATVDVTAHLSALLGGGWSYRRIAQATGLSIETLSRIPGRAYVRANTAAKIYALRPGDAGALEVGIGWVPAAGTVRRIRALRAAGYTTGLIARECGVSADSIVQISNNDRDRVRIDTAHRVADLFKRWQVIPPPRTRGSVRARNDALKRGWALPFAWDEDSIDDPAAEPQMPKDDRDAWFEDYQELKGLGLSNNQIAERMGIQRAWLITKLRRR